MINVCTRVKLGLNYTHYTCTNPITKCTLALDPSSKQANSIREREIFICKIIFQCISDPEFKLLEQPCRTNRWNI